MLEALAAAAGPDALLDLHADPEHNRAVLSLAGSAAALEDRLLALVDAARRHIDLRLQSGVHPRVGAADVVPLVPLEGTLDEAAESALRLGRRVHAELGLPVYFYGGRLGGPSLADIRAGRATPALGGDLGGPAGAVCVGARPPLVAYNVLLPGARPEAADALARGLRASAPGGLPGVQALAFRLPGAAQLSMNLFDLERAAPAGVLAEVRRRAAASGLQVGADEVVGLCPAALAPPAAAGRVLEARLAALAARRGAARCPAGEEGRALAERLRVAAAGLAGLGPDPDDLLAAAERALALARLLPAGRIEDPDGHRMLGFAARQLRAALPASTARRHPERVRLLDAEL